MRGVQHARRAVALQDGVGTHAVVAPAEADDGLGERRVARRARRASARWTTRVVGERLDRADLEARALARRGTRRRRRRGPPRRRSRARGSAPWRPPPTRTSTLGNEAPSGHSTSSDDRRVDRRARGDVDDERPRGEREVERREGVVGADEGAEALGRRVRSRRRARGSTRSTSTPTTWPALDGDHRGRAPPADGRLGRGVPTTPRRAPARRA